jgi:hypothetical protein
VAPAEDEQPIETLGAYAANEALGVGVCLWCTDRCVDDPDSFAVEDLLERGRELAVAVVDQESHPFEHSGEAEVARLLGHPGAGRVGRAARQVDAAAFELDEEQDVKATERDRLDGEEIAREHARGLLAEEVSPVRTLTPPRGLEASCEQQPSHGARRDTAAELQ